MWCIGHSQPIGTDGGRTIEIISDGVKIWHRQDLPWVAFFTF